MAKGHGKHTMKGKAKPSGRHSKGAHGNTGKQTRATGPGPGTAHESMMKGTGMLGGGRGGAY